MTQDLITIAGLTERVTYHNNETGYSVIKVNVLGERELVAIVGNTATIHAGEYVSCVGHWHVDQNHGRQFKATAIQVMPPTTIAGMEKYLASGMIKGIGPVYAGRLVAAFATEVFTVIEEAPDRVRDVEGIGPIRYKKILSSWQQQKHVRAIMLFLHQHGVSTARAVKIFKTYGEQAILKIQEDPYQLARDIRGIGFVSADQIAQRLGLEPTSMKRLKAGLQHILLTATDDGHCGLPREALLTAAATVLAVDMSLLPAALIQAIRDDFVTRDGDRLYLPTLYAQERFIAHKIMILLQAPLPWATIDDAKVLPWVQKQTQTTLAPSQRQALIQALQSKVCIITGGPGVGKTTLMRCLLTILQQRVADIMLCAPTGRAARRLSDSTGLEAKTIHRLLEPTDALSGFKMNADNPLRTSLLVIDESSMLDVPLMAAVLKALPDTAALILIGDVDQLPSVGPGRVLADLIASGRVPTLRLTEVFRQAASSRIIGNAHRINNGQLPDVSNPADTDFFFVPIDDVADAHAKLQTIVAHRLPQRYCVDARRDIQVLCPMARGTMGARTLNTLLQQTLNPQPAQTVTVFGTIFGVGDKVMQTTNDYDKNVYNGDLGFIDSIDEDEQTLTLTFEGRAVEYAYSDMDDVQLAYAMTIHKSQGSEYPVVVIPFTMQHDQLLQRNLLYTAVTRGKQLVVLLGQRQAIAIAVKQHGQTQRYTKLQQWLGAKEN